MSLRLIKLNLFVKLVYLKFKRIDVLINNGIQLNKKWKRLILEDYLKSD